MKKILFLTLLIVVIAASACKSKLDEPMGIDYAYHAHIISPNTDAKKLDDTLHIQVDFESHTGEIVHHINVRIYNKANNTEIYSKPTEAHIHEISGEYVFEDDFVLSEANGVSANTDWILVATVWSEEDGADEEMEQVEFQVGPK